MRPTLILVCTALLWLPVVACATAGGDGSDGVDASNPGIDAGGDPRVDAASSIDGVPPPDAAPPCQDTQIQLLANEGFDLGTGGGWVESGAGYDIVRADSDLPSYADPHAGLYSAWLGGLNGATRNIYQEVAIPADATDISLSLYRWVWTSDDPGIPYDLFSLTVQDTSGTILNTLAGWNNTQATGNWTLSTHAVDESLVAGQTIRVHMESVQDGAWNTNFLIDTLSLTATSCQ